MKTINSFPYPWPYDGDISPKNTALIVIDMQHDFCGEGGFLESMGYDISEAKKVINPIKKLLEELRTLNYPIIHTREGHQPDLSDLPENKRWRTARNGAEIGSLGSLGRILIRGEKGWDIIPELYPIEGEPIIDKPGKGAFFATDLDQILKLKGIKNLIFVGLTTDVCVTMSLREANDRGYECILLEDCCAASEIENHKNAIKNISLQNGIFGTIYNSVDFIKELKEITNEN